MPCPNSARERCITIGFRCSPEQNENINRLVSMSGMTKQDYILAKLNDCKIEATPSVRLYKGLCDAAKSIYLELRRLHAASELDEQTVRVMNTLVGILRDLGGFDEKEVSQTGQEDFGMMNMTRG